MHVVLATLVLTVFGLATVLRAAVAGWAAAAGVPGVGQDGLGTVGLIWWSPWMVVPGALLALWALPVGWAYWFILREKGRTWRDCFGWPTGFAIYATAFAAAASWAALPGDPGPGLRRWGLVLAVLGSFLGLLLTLHRRTRVDAARPPGPEAGRARLGRRSLAAWLVITVQVAAVLGLGAALLGEGRGAAPAWMPPVWLTAAAALGALLWWERAIRKASTEASLPSPGSADGKAGGAAAEPTGRRFIEDRERFQRSWLSSRLRLALVVTAAFFGVALVDSLGQTLYAWWASPGGAPWQPSRRAAACWAFSRPPGGWRCWWVRDPAAAASPCGRGSSWGWLPGSRLAACWWWPVRSCTARRGAAACRRATRGGPSGSRRRHRVAPAPPAVLSPRARRRADPHRHRRLRANGRGWT
jgi:hypothetical protein